MKLDILPKGLSFLGKTDSKDIAEVLSGVRESPIANSYIEDDKAKSPQLVPNSLPAKSSEADTVLPAKASLPVPELPQANALDPSYDLPRKTNTLSPILSEKAKAPPSILSPKNTAPVFQSTGAPQIEEPNVRMLEIR